MIFTHVEEGEDADHVQSLLVVMILIKATQAAAVSFKNMLLAQQNSYNKPRHVSLFLKYLELQNKKNGHFSIKNHPFSGAIPHHLCISI